MASFAFNRRYITGDNPRIFGTAGVLHVCFVFWIFVSFPRQGDTGFRGETRVCCCRRWLYEVELASSFLTPGMRNELKHALKINILIFSFLLAR